MEAALTTTLILGGARSGKTRFAQDEAERLASGGSAPIMIVTAQAFDDEMADRITRHPADRGNRWTTVAAPLDLVGAIRGLVSGDVAVVDCLTLWLSNAMAEPGDAEATFDDLIVAVRDCPARLLLVSNEVGWASYPTMPWPAASAISRAACISDSRPRSRRSSSSSPVFPSV
ncbi:hypothetical protein BH09PSE1_BH09PSE1_00600 [soil metagenome]